MWSAGPAMLLLLLFLPASQAGDPCQEVAAVCDLAEERTVDMQPFQSAEECRNLCTRTPECAVFSWFSTGDASSVRQAVRSTGEVRQSL